MFLILAIILAIIWLGGFAFFASVVGGLIHLVLVVAVILLILHFVTGSGRFGRRTP